MPVPNLLVAAALDEIADRLEIQGANPFRVRAYRNAARAVEPLADDVKQLAERGATLEGRPGIGADLAGKIAEIATTGSCALLRELRRQMPASITELLKVPGLGPKRAKALWQALDLRSPAQVLRAAREGRIRAVRGFGEPTERRIENALAARLAGERRFTLDVASEFAEAMVRVLSAAPGAERVVVAGSFRRMRESVGDLDILVTAANGPAVVEHLLRTADVDETLAHGPTRASVRLRGGPQVDLRVVPRASFGAALVYFTGSKAHNIALRRLAQARGLKINEYGVFRGERRIAGATEASVYRAVGLPVIPPELREDRGELQAAREHRLPALVALDDLRGDLHVHTDAGDGRESLAAMAAAARERGFAYVAIADPSRRPSMSHGLDAAGLARQAAAIDDLNATFDDFRVLRGVECEILDDGRLDLSDDVLAGLDLVVAAVHGRFDLDRARQTERLLRALGHPAVRVLAHPTGRVVGEREPCALDMLQVVRKARDCGTWLELDAHPSRLDLDDTACRMCRDEGALVAVDADAHGARDFDRLRFGIGQARRGWLRREDVVNTRTLAQLERLLAAPAPRRARRAPARTA